MGELLIWMNGELVGTSERSRPLSLSLPVMSPRRLDDGVKAALAVET